MRISKNKIKKIVSEQYKKELKLHKRNKKIAKLVKEEVSRVLDEDANDDTFEMLDAITAALGEKETLENIVQAMDRQTAHDTLGYIAQQYGIPLELDEETKPHEPDRTQGRDVPEDRIRS